MAYTPPTVGASGLTVPLYSDILANLIAQYQGYYGSTTYLGTDSADYQDIAVRALNYSDANALLQAIYFAISPLTATGTSLDLIAGQIIGITRKVATYSTVILTLTGTPGTVITNGIAQDTTGNKWLLPSSVTIGSGGTVSVTAQAQTAGNITANAGTIIIRATPTAGWTGVTNPAAATPGAPTEPDSQYRARLIVGQAHPSVSLLAGTAAIVAAVPGVTRSVVYENQGSYTASSGLVSTSGTTVTLINGYPFDSTMAGQNITINNVIYTVSSVTNSTTLVLTASAGTQSSVAFSIGIANSLGPAHSITAVVEGGTQAAIAEAIYANKNPGCLTNGTTAVGVTDPNNGNITTTISFDILGYTVIYVSMNVHGLTGFTSATQTAIQTAIVNYLNGLGIGQSVVFSELYGAALGVNTNQYAPLFSIRSALSGYESASTTASTTSGSASITVASTTGIATGQTAVGNGIPNNTTVSSLTTGEVSGLTITTGGSAYTVANGLSTTGGHGSGLTVNITSVSSGAITGVTVASAGSGYLDGDVVTVVQSGASGGTLTVSAVDGTVVLSQNATATASNVSVTFFTTGTSDIPVNYNEASQGLAVNVVVNSV